MSKRITRYALLIACLLLAGAWGWSVSHSTTFRYVGQDTWNCTLSRGQIRLGKSNQTNEITNGFHSWRRISPAEFSLTQRMGLTLPAWKRTTIGMTTYAYVFVPFWTLFAPLLLITLWRWFPTIRNRVHKNQNAELPAVSVGPERGKIEIIRQLIRYTSLILCLVVACAWGWSIRYQGSVHNFGETSWSCTLIMGRIRLAMSNLRYPFSGGFEFRGGTQPAGIPLSDRVGLILPDWESNPNSAYIQIPLWTLFITLLLITLWQWYPIIRSRHQSHSAGFLVDMKEQADSGMPS